MTINSAALLRLLAFASPAFPTGGFAYSQGLEWAVESGAVTTPAALTAWLADTLTHGSARTDAILLRHAHRAHADASAVQNLTDLAAATTWPSERQAETLAQGAAFAAATPAWGAIGQGAYPVVFGAFAAAQGITEDDATLGYLAAWASAQISAAIRLSLCGQSAGLRVLAALEPTLIATAATTTTATLDDLGGACFLADIAAMRHETQYARLFRS